MNAIHAILHSTGTRRRGAQRARWIDKVEDDLRTFHRLRGWQRAVMDRTKDFYDLSHKIK